jgi:hypothetical protein
MGSAENRSLRESKTPSPPPLSPKGERAARVRVLYPLALGGEWDAADAFFSRDRPVRGLFSDATRCGLQRRKTLDGPDRLRNRGR